METDPKARGERVAVVFVSYERRAEAKARQVAEALERSGHQAWSDAMLPPHRGYSGVIEEHLTSADVVLVLWSKAAAQSDWVMAEADFGRERQKLVQVTLDESIPPMPFNRIHCASLAGWNGASNDKEWLKVLDSVGQISGAADQPPRDARGCARSQPATARPTGRFRSVRSSRGLAVLAVGLGCFADRSRRPRAGSNEGRHTAVRHLEFRARRSVLRRRTCR